MFYEIALRLVKGFIQALGLKALANDKSQKSLDLQSCCFSSMRCIFIETLGSLETRTATVYANRFLVFRATNILRTFLLYYRYTPYVLIIIIIIIIIYYAATSPFIIFHCSDVELVVPESILPLPSGRSHSLY